MLTSWNEFLQSFSTPILDEIFLTISNLGNELIFMAAIASIYLCIDKYKGLHLAIGLLSSFTLNNGIKHLFQIPRPFEYNKVLRRIDLYNSPGYSFPSAHAQLSASLATGIVYFYHKMGIVCCILAFLIGFSRIYLGVHTLVDVIVGFLLGSLWMLVSLKLSQLFLKHHRLWLFIYLVPCYLFYFVNHDIDLLKLTAVFTSFLIGFIIEDTYLQYQASLPLPASFKLLLLLIGCTIIKIPLDIVLPDNLFCTYLSYFLIGIWISLFCPWLLIIIKKFRYTKGQKV